LLGDSVQRKKPVRSFDRAGTGLKLPLIIGDNLIMPCNKRLSPWVIVRLLPNLQRRVVGRFRSRSDAEGHLQALQRLMPDAEMIILFDVDD
jgi:hypothetical protein